jgi:hypothetical protein
VRNPPTSASRSPKKMGVVEPWGEPHLNHRSIQNIVEHRAMHFN